MKKIKILAIMLFVFTLPCVSVANIYANTNNDESIATVQDIEPRGHVLVMRYKKINGISFHRRWCESCNDWYDANWIQD